MSEGGVPGGDAGDIFIRVAALIKHSGASGVPVAGYVCDIAKCFNALQRMPVRAALKKIGVADGVLDLWHDYLGRIQ